MEEKEEDEMSLKNAHGFFICEKKTPQLINTSQEQKCFRKAK